MECAGATSQITAGCPPRPRLLHLTQVTCLVLQCYHTPPIFPAHRPPHVSPWGVSAPPHPPVPLCRLFPSFSPPPPTTPAWGLLCHRSVGPRKTGQPAGCGFVPTCHLVSFEKNHVRDLGPRILLTPRLALDVVGTNADPTGVAVVSSGPSLLHVAASQEDTGSTIGWCRLSVVNSVFL